MLRKICKETGVGGVIHGGQGLTNLNRLLSCLNHPTLNWSIYKRYECEVGPVIEKAAKESCKKAAEEEGLLVISKAEELCKDLLEDIAAEIMEQLKPFKNCDSINERQFDKSVGNIVYIVVSYDTRWSKRGNGRSYDSHNGYGVIAFLGGKILDYKTKNRLCRKCNNGHSKDDHDCRQNHIGSSKVIEARAGEELINQSEILKETGLHVIAMVGDEDSTTLKHVRENRLGKIYKLSDKVHLKRGLKRQLYKTQGLFKELKSKKAIPHILKLFNYAVIQNKKKASELASILRSIPDHLFNNHENCSTWCTKHDEEHVVVLEDPKLWNQLKEIFDLYMLKMPRKSQLLLLHKKTKL
ncbi:hypothetical protein PV327_004051 [Microctonus hyperodae]|uniref:Mutator-like transposase domain-containing protein n=1 Tax=Microctonus hyperodae TaxID=165561 RepID=A0AA39G5N2_MICHY|nr:hypothetical protein PV327_004051 [Microctonus hyperodae]